MSLVAHLIELRGRLLRAVLAIVVAFVAVFPFARPIYNWLAQPLLARLPAGGSMIATGVTTPFFIPMKVAGLVALLLALPMVLYQAWAFVAPGLYAHEKRWVAPLILVSTGLFVAGMAFAYYAVMPMVFGFVTAVAPEGVAVMTDIASYFDFVLGLFVAFGVTFEVPVLVVVLIKVGLVTVAKLREWRPYVIVGAFVVGAIFTPPDVISQLMMAIPLWLLYELGIVVGAAVAAPRQN
ncbi:MAG: twin-arginine translocase subunit TatC [Betaproteobacteria bacterium]|nr:twin-arginine translocase subunit TatC [Betaproteobacteria bacterium]NBS93469.1 twin-arginine translocase subunit TatC [Betaproteobacteria bacterium]NBY53302.1 twin-arginine translocase subunit TatC [Betaproteobacteria bacterium]NCA24297.1 twin-arginine translocase subunit TatC [Betaproteobacteria bacterium]NCU85172.1 twin-arginine translocase subunit TatC [Betaproteobacteria bacterium]